MGYQHLNEEDRDKIAILFARGLGTRSIARDLGRHHSTIAREIVRNATKNVYLSHNAHCKAIKRQQNKPRPKRLKTYAIQYDVERKLMDHYSPEKVAGRLAQEHGKPVISHEAIYQWIYCQAPHLIDYLPRRHKKRRRGRKKSARASAIAGRISISDRPAEANNRSCVGHWETDLVESCRTGKKALQVCVERKTRYAKVSLVKNKTADISKETLCRVLREYPSGMRKTITYDNGKENTMHMDVNEKLGMKSYFCEPYHSWEKGSVENVNGEIRRFFPKGVNFDRIGEEEVRRVEAWLNNRPMKVLGYQTPGEVFEVEIKKMGRKEISANCRRCRT